METVKHKNWSAKLWNFAALLTQIFTLTVPEKSCPSCHFKKKGNISIIQRGGATRGKPY